jgi:hypothetical protein
MKYDNVEQGHLQTYFVGEIAKDKGIDWAVEKLIEQKPEMANYEYWSFMKHTETWKGWHIVGVMAGLYVLEDDILVAVGD